MTANLIVLLGAVDQAIAAVRAYKDAHSDERVDHYTGVPGSVLSAYCGGDISFDQAVMELTRNSRSISSTIPNYVLAAIEAERRYQDQKWGADKQQSLLGYLLILRHELQEAEAAWMKNRKGSRQTPLEEILQVVAVGVKCLEIYGLRGCARSTNDVTEAEMRQERSDASRRRFGAV